VSQIARPKKINPKKKINRLIENEFDL